METCGGCFISTLLKLGIKWMHTDIYFKGTIICCHLYKCRGDTPTLSALGTSHSHRSAQSPQAKGDNRLWWDCNIMSFMFHIYSLSWFISLLLALFHDVYGLSKIWPWLIGGVPGL